mmetsp:Transcript_42597/g.48952  ORF Transcript_42597/g.48952 Transcript_42597/m.48952 type:complete len:138 (-) Transcript_42597:408-821(-)
MESKTAVAESQGLWQSIKSYISSNFDTVCSFFNQTTPAGKRAVLFSLLTAGSFATLWLYYSFRRYLRDIQDDRYTTRSKGKTVEKFSRKNGKKPWVVIIGGSEEQGEFYWHKFAHLGFNIVIVSQDLDRKPSLLVFE